MKNKKDILVDAIGNIDDQYIKEAHENKKKKFVFDWALCGKVLTGVLCVFLIVVIIPNFFGMGAASAAPKDAEGSSYLNGVTSDYAAIEKFEYPAEAAPMAEEAIQEDKKLLENEKKLIVTGNINIETLDFDKLIDNLLKNVDEVGGYIQNSSISTNRYESRYYNASIRIPADKYNEFLSKTKETGNVTWYDESVDDITTTYYDLEARVNSLKAEETKVLEFYDKATNLEELMSIENRLTDIRYEIDSIETRIKNYDLLTNYSTLNISIVETKAYTKTNDNFLSRLSLSFSNGFKNFVNSIENFVIDLVYNIWLIILIAIVTIITVVVIKKRKRK